MKYYRKVSFLTVLVLLGLLTFSCQDEINEEKLVGGTILKVNMVTVQKNI